VDALTVPYVTDICFTAANALAAMRTDRFIYLCADDGKSAEKAVDRAQRAYETAKRAIAEYAGQSKNQQNSKFPGEENAEHREITAVAGMAQKPDGRFKGACRAYIFAKTGKWQI